MSFIDCHCHAFNFVDIPMYLTLSDKISMSTAGRLKVASGALLYLPKLITSKNALKSQLENYKEFVLFFERSVKRNCEEILLEIRENIKTNLADLDDNSEILITPLVMDFDKLLEQEMPAQVGKEPSVREQYKRLEEAIASPEVASIPNTKVCPFVGFDLRKLRDADKDRLEGFKNFWSANNTLGKTSISDLESGKLLGIKLYPPIGFNPCPPNIHENYKKFYKWCCQNDIPLTTHCQKGSYSAGEEKKNLDRHTTPENWKRLLNKPEFKNLRINFAHLGGETGLDDMFEPFRTDKDSWTYILIQLLKNYPNTYADIAAYNYAKKEHRNNLAKIFEKDAAGKFGKGQYNLTDKLLWGSDVPMVISDKTYREGFKSKGKAGYSHYFKGFIESLEASSLEAEQVKDIIKKMTNDNPKKFLRLA
ncbi:MAG: amidohydrolase family protein [Thermodesulfobacteriota bacterium]